MASSSDDDTPLLKSKMNGVKSADRVSKRDDALTNRITAPGISIRNGPAGEMDVDNARKAPRTNGVAAAKRKARSGVTNGKSYKEDTSSESEDNMPLSKRRKTLKDAPSDSDDAPLTRKTLKDAPSDDAPLIRKTLKDAPSDSDDAPLIRKTKVVIKKPPKITAAQIGESDESDTPLRAKLAKKKQEIEKDAEKTAKAIRAAEANATKRRKSKQIESDSDDDIPLARKKAVNGVKRPPDDSDEKTATPVKKNKTQIKVEGTPPVKKAKAKAIAEPTQEDLDAQAEEDEYRWWEDPTNGDGTKKWTTLEHNGVVFPPPYEPLPKHVQLRYDGNPVSLHVDAEEVASFYGTMLHSTVNVENPTFNKNFFADFKAVLDKTGHAKDAHGKTVKITSFEKCDFKAIFDHYEGEREKKRNLPAAEKKALKAAKEEAESAYMFCMWDGRKQKVGNFRVEPPGLFRGRGEHPKTGKVKFRVHPEQVTINIGKGATVPQPPDGHRWKEVKHDQEGTWLAMWQENINGCYKYVMLAANSDIKGQSDYKKFEKARELKKHIDRIRKDYTTDLKSDVMADRQRATAVYLIDKFALRAGNEKGEDEADTVGCCSLKFENVTLKPPNKVIFDFLGKDSIRFYDEVEVAPQVFKNLKIFKKPPKKDGDQIFDRLSTASLNKHLSSYMPGLTAKVFRTYNASWTMSELLKKMKPTGSIPEKVKAYNDANREVAILCNHKRTVAAGHAGQVEKLNEKIKGLRYQQWRVKQMMLDVDPKGKKKRGAEYFERPDDLDDEWIRQHQEAELDERREKIRKRFAKDNEKLEAEGKKPMKETELKERLEEVDALARKYKKENRTGKVEAEGKSPSIEKLDANLVKIEQRVNAMKLQLEDKEDNKEVALGTSKINYIDPRLTVVFSKKFDVPIERFFSKTLREKFDWAIKSVDEDWEF